MTTYKYLDYEIIKDEKLFTIIDDNGSGHTEDSLEDAKKTINGWVYLTKIFTFEGRKFFKNSAKVADDIMGPPGSLLVNAAETNAMTNFWKFGKDRKSAEAFAAKLNAM
jgi:hypothetical protein